MPWGVFPSAKYNMRMKYSIKNPSSRPLREHVVLETWCGGLNMTTHSSPHVPHWEVEFMSPPLESCWSCKDLSNKMEGSDQTFKGQAVWEDSAALRTPAVASVLPPASLLGSVSPRRGQGAWETPSQERWWSAGKRVALTLHSPTIWYGASCLGSQSLIYSG